MVAVTLVCGLDVVVLRIRQKLSSCVTHGEMKAERIWKPSPMSVETAHEFIAIHPSKLPSALFSWVPWLEFLST